MPMLIYASLVSSNRFGLLDLSFWIGFACVGLGPSGNSWITVITISQVSRAGQCITSYCKYTISGYHICRCPRDHQTFARMYAS